MFSKTASAALAGAILISSASAVPTSYPNPAPAAFGLIALHSTEGAVHLRSVNAVDHQLFIGRDTASFCPTETVESCPAGNTTSFLAGAGGSLSMNVEVPGGQQVFIDKTGTIGYTTAHSASIPEGAILTGFKYTPPPQEGQVGSLEGPASFTACPTGEAGVYQVKAVLEGLSYEQCISIGLGAGPVQGVGAWEYA